MKKKCPLLGKACLEHGCEWYTNLRGHNPQTGQEMDSWGCAITALPILLVQNAHETRKGKAAIESFRNEMVADNQRLLSLANPIFPRPPDKSLPDDRPPE